VPTPTYATRHPLGLFLVVLAVVLIGVRGEDLLELRSSVATTADYWRQPRGTPGGLLYVALGDSTAQGIGASRPELGYVGLVAERLRRATGRPVRVVNLSRSGARIEDLLREQVPALSQLRPDLVTVAIGGNDVRAYDPVAFADRVRRLTAQLPAGSVLADVPYFMHGRWERDALEASDAVRRSGVARGLAVVPLHEAQRREGAIAMLNQFAADWFHPNDHGYRVWADAFWATIRTSPAGDQLHLTTAADLSLAPCDTAS